MKALITVRRITKYATVVEMTKEKFDEYQHTLEHGTGAEVVKAEKQLDRLIDTKDWQSDDFDSLESLEPFES